MHITNTGLLSSLVGELNFRHRWNMQLKTTYYNYWLYHHVVFRFFFWLMIEADGHWTSGFNTHVHVVCRDGDFYGFICNMYLWVHCMYITVQNWKFSVRSFGVLHISYSIITSVYNFTQLKYYFQKNLMKFFKIWQKHENYDNLVWFRSFSTTKCAY